MNCKCVCMCAYICAWFYVSDVLYELPCFEWHADTHCSLHPCMPVFGRVLAASIPVRVCVCCTCVCMLYVCVRALHTCVCVCVRVFAVRVLEFSAHLHRCMSNAWIDLSPMPGVIPVCVYVCGGAVLT